MEYVVKSKGVFALKWYFPPKKCLIGYDLETLALDGRRVLLVLTFGEWAGAEKQKSLKEIKTQMGCGKDIVVIRVLWTCTPASLALHNQGL